MGDIVEWKLTTSQFSLKSLADLILPVFLGINKSKQRIDRALMGLSWSVPLIKE